ncbi:MAG: lysophospholipid acyltransferase family protein [Nitrospinota bacterium]|nr:lysophospholipid acyltransferase family protein [Nitrospinota bacterium]
MSRKRNFFLDKTAYLSLKYFTWYCQSTSRNLALAGGSAVGWVFWMLLRLQRKRLKITLDNMRILYPDKSEEELMRLARRTARHFGRFLTDGCRLPLIKRSTLDDNIKFEGLEHYIKAHRQGKGVILSTAHFGHFEVAACSLAAMGYPVWSIIREVDNRDLDKFMDEARCAPGLGVIKKERAAREVLAHLRAGHTVTVHIDQKASFNHVYVPFFGKYASTFSTPAVMSMRTGAPVLSMLCFRDDATDTYIARISPPVEYIPTGDRNADIRQIIMKLNHSLEQAVRQAPEQWFWFHGRWKKEPDAEETAAAEKELALIESTIKGAPPPGAGAPGAGAPGVGATS